MKVLAFLSFNAASGNAIRATEKYPNGIVADLGGFNAASGNAIRATRKFAKFLEYLFEFQCRKRQCYTRDLKIMSLLSNLQLGSMPQAAMLSARLQSSLGDEPVDPEFQCRKRQCYTRDSVSRSPRIYWAQTEIFTTFPFSHRKEAIFRGHRVFKISENIMSALDFQWLIVSTIFCCNLPRFSGQKRKNYF